MTGADAVFITDELARRPSRAPDHAGEARALTQLGEAMSTQPDAVLQRLVESTIALTGCGSAGISILEPGGTQGMFRWVATAGAWAPYRGGTMPREESPCGAVLAQDAILLMRQPERLFPSLRQAGPSIGEGLLAPFRIAGVPVGTVWAIKHGADDRFDAEDARLLETLARFASAAHQMVLALRRAEADRLESDTRLRALAHASSDAFYVMSADMGELRALSGRAFLTDTTSPSRAWLRDYIPPEDHGAMLAAIRTAIGSKGVFELEHRVRRADGTIGWAVSRAVPIIGADGAIAEWFGAASDISARKRTEAALHDSEARFRQFSDESTNVLWIRDAATLRLEFASLAFDAIYGVSGPPRGGDDRLRAWVSLVVPEDRQAVMTAFRRLRAGQRTELEFRIRRPADGAIRWIRASDFPVHDAAGRVRWVAGIGADITDARELGERRNVMVAELQHRTRNLIAVVRSLADRTLATAPTLDDFGRRFRLRLSALSRVQGLLSHLAGGNRVTFDALLQTELVAHGMIDGTNDDAVDASADGRAERVTLSGPAGVPLRSGTVQTFALALHELATNAVKYGALAAPGGRLAVTWHVASAADGEPWLHVVWQETGVAMPAPDAPARGGGYGRELIERALPYQLNARTTYELGDDGVRCTIAVPISQAMPVPDAEP